MIRSLGSFVSDVSQTDTVTNRILFGTLEGVDKTRFVCADGSLHPRAQSFVSSPRVDSKMLALLLGLALCCAAVCAVHTDDKLQVHLIMHSHDDPGWLKTADQYYTGANASIYLASVQYIFDSVVTELQKDPERHFTFCEISFLSRWYYEQNARTKELFKNLVRSGQITIVNGGWVMHDEASTHYMSMIDQTTLGNSSELYEHYVFASSNRCALLSSRRPQVPEGRTELPSPRGVADRPIRTLEHARLAVLRGRL
jgi:hypothetical protein